MKLSGVYVATVTPFHPDGSLDLGHYRQHLAYLVEAGVHGLVPCGTTGEGPTLTRQERVQLIEACLEAASRKNIEVIAGCGSNSTASARELIAEAEGLGVDGTLIVTPYYNKPTAAGVLAHYLHLADHAQKPIVLYHVPSRTHVNIPLDVIARLFEHPQIAGIKEASGSYAYWSDLCALAKKSGKTVVSGDDDAFAAIQAMGGKGLISASANTVPSAFVELYRLMTQGHWAKAMELQQRLTPLVRAHFAETNPGPAKYLMHKIHGTANALRLPLVPVSSATERLLVQEWERFQDRSTDA